MTVSLPYDHNKFDKNVKLEDVLNTPSNIKLSNTPSIKIFIKI